MREYVVMSRNKLVKRNEIWCKYPKLTRGMFSKPTWSEVDDSIGSLASNVSLSQPYMYGCICALYR